MRTNDRYGVAAVVVAIVIVLAALTGYLVAQARRNQTSSHSSDPRGLCWRPGGDPADHQSAPGPVNHAARLTGLIPRRAYCLGEGLPGARARAKMPGYSDQTRTSRPK